MFWQSVVGGFSYFQYWEVWVAVVAYLGVAIGSMLVPFSFSKDSSEPGCGGGIYIFAGRPLIMGASLGVLVAWLFPILVGLPPNSFGEFISALPLAIGIGIGSTIIFAVLTLVPIIGGLINSYPGIPTYVQSVITLYFLAPGALTAHDIHGSFDTILPGFWEAVGYALIMIAVMWVILLTSAAIAATVKSGGEAITSLTGLAVAAVAGLFPFFMYTYEVSRHLMDALRQ